jgi:hypothetical protein
MSYMRFGAMILTSTLVMFALMYLNTFALEHLFFSETRAYMALLMGAAMAIIMLSFMLAMYSNQKANIAIFAGSAIVFGLALWLVRSQETVQDRSFMAAMIPHHSIAIMTSSRSELSDPRVQKLAEDIALAQNREIAEMRYLIAALAETGEAAEIYHDPPARVGSVEEALSNLLIASLDPAPLTRDELPDEAAAELACGFRRVEGEDPILWTAEGGGVTKLNGIIIPLQAAGYGTYVADGISMEVREVDGGFRSGAELIFTLEQGLEIGYRGFYDCAA